MNTSFVEPLADRLRELTGLRLRAHRTNYGVVAASALLVGALISGGIIAMQAFKRAAQRNQHRQVDQVRDKTLKDTFPASDPPATQFFDIPANRR